jgi:hypothetical protein
VNGPFTLRSVPEGEPGAFGERIPDAVFDDPVSSTIVRGLPRESASIEGARA